MYEEKTIQTYQNNHKVLRMNWEARRFKEWSEYIKQTVMPWRLWCRLSDRFTKHLGKENRFEDRTDRNAV